MDSRLQGVTPNYNGVQLHIEISVHSDNEPSLHEIKELLDCCDSIKLDDESLTVAASAQAVYEEQTTRIKASVTSKFTELRQAAETLAVEWCRVSQSRMMEQPYLQILNNDAYCLNASPAYTWIPLSCVDLGVLVNAGVFRSYHRIQYGRGSVDKDFECKTSAQNIVGDFENDMSRLSVRFQCSHNDAECYKLAIRYSSIAEILVDSSFGNSKEFSCFYISLKRPPLVFRKAYKSGQNDQIRCGLRTRDWQRVLSFYGCTSKSGVIGGCAMLRLEIPTKLIIDKRERNFSGSQNAADVDHRQRFFDILGRLKLRGRIPVKFCSIHVKAVSREQIGCEPIWKRIPVFELQKPEYEQPTSDSVLASYFLEALFRRGLMVTAQFDGNEKLVDDFLNLVISLYKKNKRATLLALEQLLDAVDERRNISFYYGLHRLFQSIISGQQKFERFVPEGCMRVKKVVVTPSRLVPLSPELSMGNRVLRTFKEDNVLRLIFLDDNFWKMGKPMGEGWIAQQSYVEGSEGYVISRELSENTVSEALKAGITVGGRTYNFLGWSNSQMRDHGVYMIAEYFDKDTKQHVTADVIRDWTGNFDEPMPVAKLMARMGQCFTQSKNTIELKKGEYITERDIKSDTVNPEDGDKYVFSDGIGRMSLKTAKEICDILKIPFPVPSAFQVRFNGYKGMLSVDPSIDKDPTGIKVIFRKSMCKFDADSSEFLEVVKYSMPSAVYLNRPLIMILDQVSKKQSITAYQRVTNRIHMLLQNELYKITDMLCSEADCIEVLEERTPAYVKYRDLRQSGFTITTEPFFRSMLQAVHRTTVEQNLQNKLKIRIPMSEGRTMFGILDETGTLQCEQVFIKYSIGDRCRNNHIVYTGTIMVTKNPCVVPGDVRLFQAVDKPELSHCVDVIVFPRYGPRPHTDEMAGSDLDGDEYAVFFDPQLRFDENEPALNRKKLEAKKKEIISETDMIDAFVRYLHMDSIGNVATTHLAMSDLLSINDCDGMYSDVCMEIAKLHSCQVDFPKTGKEPPPLEPEQRPKKWPDFLERWGQPMYRSECLVGYLYRKVKSVQETLDRGNQSLQSTLDEDLEFTNWREFEENAADVYGRYSLQLQALIDQYGIENEGALVSGHMSQLRRINNNEKEDFSYYSTERVVEMRFNAMYKQFRNEFFEEFGGEERYLSKDDRGFSIGKVDSTKVTPSMLRKASAWYMLAYGPKNTTIFRSFPWIVWDVLCEIKTKKFMQDEFKFRFDPLQDMLGEELEKVCESQIMEYTEMMSNNINEKSSATLERYCLHYEGLSQVFYGLHIWAQGERLYIDTHLTLTHLALVLLMYCTGQSEWKMCDTEDVLLQPIDTTAECTDTEKLGVGIKGKLLLRFLRYIGSRQFTTKPIIDLNSLGFRSRDRGTKYKRVSQAGFKTYHAVAITGSFDPMHLTKSDSLGSKLSWDFGELSPIPFEIPRSVGMQTKSLLLEQLKGDTGIYNVQLRHAFEWKDVALVSGTGTAEARQKVRDWLLDAKKKLDNTQYKDNRTQALTSYLNQFE